MKRVMRPLAHHGDVGTDDLAQVQQKILAELIGHQFTPTGVVPTALVVTVRPGKPISGRPISGVCASITASKSACEAVSRWSAKGNSPETGNSSTGSVAKNARHKAQPCREDIHEPVQIGCGRMAARVFIDKDRIRIALGINGGSAPAAHFGQP